MAQQSVQLFDRRTLLDHYSLLGHVAPRLTSQLENLATEALLYLLRKYGTAREAFVNVVSTIGNTVPSDLTFDSQVRMRHGSIPDLVGQTADKRDVLLVEAKFWAPLTSNQPVGYLRRLPDDQQGMVLFVAPEGRQEALWQELAVRCQAEGLELGEETEDSPRWRAARVIGAGRLASVSWSYVLDGMEDQLEEAGDVRGAHEVWQLRGLVRKLEERPPPPDPDSLRSMVDEVAVRLVEAGVFDTKGFRATPGSYYYRRFRALSGRINWSIGFDEQYAAYFEESLLWLRGPENDEWGLDPSSVPDGCTLRFYESDTRPLFPLDVPEQAAREVVIQSLVDQVKGVAELLQQREPPLDRS